MKYVFYCHKFCTIYCLNTVYEGVYPTEMTRKKKLDEQIDKDKVAV